MKHPWNRVIHWTLLTTVALVPASPAIADTSLTLTIGQEPSWGTLNSSIGYAEFHHQAISRAYYEKPSPLPEGQTQGLALCASISDISCNGPGNLYAQMLSPACADTYKKDCVSGITVIDGTSRTVLDYFANSDGPIIGGAESPYSPSGHSPGFFTLPEKYLGPNVFIAPIVTNSYSRVNGNLYYQGFRAQLIAVKILSGEYKPLEMDISNPGWGFGIKSESKGDWRQCLWTISNGCVTTAGPMPRIGFQLNYQSGFPIGGWWFGRLNNAALSSGTLSEGISKLSISGEVTTVQIVPTTTISLSSSELEKLKSNSEFNQTFGVSQGSSLDTLNIGMNGPINRNSSTGKAFSMGFAIIDAARRALGDKSKFDVNVWSMNSLFINGDTPCLDPSKFQGLVATNAMLYSIFPPTFSNGVFSSEIAGLRFDSNNNVFQGNYSLVLSNEFVQCLYGIKEIPISASVSITSENGVSEDITTAIGNDGQWTTLNIKKFTSSRQMIGIKIQSAITSTSSPTPKPTPTDLKNSNTKVSTIVCLKGKLVKKIVGKNPKCPLGFKLKK